ncbi:MAG: hypothetical protein ACYCQJ_03915 [Nitrososphaerales archaeon]
MCEIPALEIPAVAVIAAQGKVYVTNMTNQRMIRFLFMRPFVAQDEKLVTPSMASLIAIITAAHSSIGTMGPPIFEYDRELALMISNSSGAQNSAK